MMIVFVLSLSFRNKTFIHSSLRSFSRQNSVAELPQISNLQMAKIIYVTEQQM